jgi:hypothetical protein
MLSTTSTSSKKLPEFIPPYQITLPGWLRSAHTIASTMVVSADNKGLVGFFATVPEYQLHMGNPDPAAIHVPLARPQDLGENANDVQISRHTAFENAYLREQSALADFKNMVLQSLDPTTTTLLEENLIGVAGLTL